MTDDPRREPIAVHDRRIDGPHGDIPVRVYRAAGEPDPPALVWLHGGAFVGGDLDMPEADWVSRQLAARGITVVSVCYRLAIEGVHYPIPSDDGLAAFEWVTSRTSELGIDATRIAIGGASAGANLAAGIALRCRDGALTQPCTVVLAYPLVHAVPPEPTPRLATRLATLPPRIQQLNSRIGEINLNYAGTVDVFDDPYAFAANSEVSGLPPVFVLNADTDMMRPSGEAFAAAIALAGGDVLVMYEPGTVHGYLNQPGSPTATRSIDRISTWLRGPIGPLSQHPRRVRQRCQDTPGSAEAAASAARTCGGPAIVDR